MKRSDFVMKPLRLSVVRRKKTQSSFFSSVSSFFSSSFSLYKLCIVCGEKDVVPAVEFLDVAVVNSVWSKSSTALPKLSFRPFASTRLLMSISFPSFEA